MLIINKLLYNHSITAQNHLETSHLKKERVKLAGCFDRDRAEVCMGLLPQEWLLLPSVRPSSFRMTLLRRSTYILSRVPAILDQ